MPFTCQLLRPHMIHTVDFLLDASPKNGIESSATLLPFLVSKYADTSTAGSNALNTLGIYASTNANCLRQNVDYAMMSSPADRRFYWTVNFKDPPCLNTSMPMLATPS